MTGLRIDPLADVPQRTATVMTWIFNQFGAAPGRTLPDVIPGARGQGIAAAFAWHLEGVAAIMGYERLYLHTPDAVAYYRRLGWIDLAQSDQDGKTTHILYKTLAPGESA